MNDLIRKQNSADFPFHVVGGAFETSRGGVASALLSNVKAVPLQAPEKLRAVSSRRRRLWEIPHKFHCPVIGVCFACDELRSLMSKVMRLPKETTDFVLHTTAVGSCEERSRLAELLHKTLEKRYQLVVRQFAAYKCSQALRLAWGRASQEAGDIPAALWAAWTHPACDSQLEQDIYADIHMIQHQVASRCRADKTTMKRWHEENAELRRELETARFENGVLRREKVESALLLNQQVTDLRAELVAKAAWGQAKQRELQGLRSSLPELPERQALVLRLQDAEQMAERLKCQLDEQAKELVRLREFAKYAEETFESLAREDEALAELPASDLSGKCVLCVGGRTGAVHSYREVVEQSGGKFLHHDGGLEESLHRIDGALAAADIVICQAGCISHNAYWRVKDLCKRTGKSCMFVKSSSVSSFGRIVSEAGRKNSSGP